MKISRQALEEIERHARQNLPDECCGIVMASRNSPDHATRVARSENAENKHPKKRYALGHKAHIKAVQMEITGQARILGYYHSHPGGSTRPSAFDRERAVSGALYLITAVGSGPARHAAWRLEGDDFVPARLEVSG